MTKATKQRGRHTLLGLSVSTAILLISGQAFSAASTYTATEDFSNTLTAGAEQWVGQYENAGGGYRQDQAGETEFPRYNAAVSPPNFIPSVSDGNYLNFYARYDDAGIRYTFLARNFGAFDGAVNAGKDGDYTLSACYFLMPPDKGGADFANGVTAGLGIRVSGNGYAQWPGDLNLNKEVAISPATRTGEWNRISLNITLTDASRVDAGFWVKNPVLTAPYVSTGVLYDNFYFGPAANTPTTLCAGESATRPEDAPSGVVSKIPTLPIGGLFALIGLMGWLGLRRRG